MFTHTCLHAVPGAPGSPHPPRGPATVQRLRHCGSAPDSPAGSGWGSQQARLPALAPSGRQRVAQNLALKGQFLFQELRPPAPGFRLGGRGSSPTTACSLGWGHPVPLATSSLGSATGAVVGKYSTATHRPRGPRRPTWCRRWAGSRPPACRDAQSRQWLSPTWWGLGLPGLLRVQSPGSVPPQPARQAPTTPPCWAGQIRTCSRARSPPDWWINLGTALPCPGPLPGSLGMLPEKLLHPWVLGQSPKTPAPETPECPSLSPWEGFHSAGEVLLWALVEEME